MRYNKTFVFLFIVSFFFVPHPVFAILLPCDGYCPPNTPTPRPSNNCSGSLGAQNPEGCFCNDKARCLPGLYCGFDDGPGGYPSVCLHLGGASLPAPTYDISGYVWIDNDRDGVKDNTEPYYTGSLTVHLSGAASASTNTAAGANGQYSFNNFLAGSYIVSITPPAGFAATTSRARLVTLGPNRSNSNFGIVPVYSISGSIFNDSNKDYVKNNGETKDWSGEIRFRTEGNLSVDSSKGIFRISGLSAGIYIIRYTSLLPTGYIFRHPRNGPSPYFSVRVGANCSVSPASPNPKEQATCSSRGDITNMNFIITNSIPWMQVYGLDVRLDNGFNNWIPAAPFYSPYASVVDHILSENCVLYSCKISVE